MPRSIRRGRSRPRGQRDPALVDRIGAAVMRMRRDLVKPPELCLPLPTLGRSVDSAKVHACVAIAEASGEGADGEQSLSVKDVAEALHLEHSTVSRLIGEMAEDGLVIRGTDPQDRRRTTVELTDQGRVVVEDGTGIRSWAMGRVFQEWSDRDLRTLAAMLERMADTLAQRMPEVVDEARDHFTAASTSPDADQAAP